MKNNKRANEADGEGKEAAEETKKEELLDPIKAAKMAERAAIKARLLEPIVPQKANPKGASFP